MWPVAPTTLVIGLALRASAAATLSPAARPACAACPATQLALLRPTSLALRLHQGEGGGEGAGCRVSGERERVG